MAYSRAIGGFKPYGAVLRCSRYRSMSVSTIGQGDMCEINTDGSVKATIVVSGTRCKLAGVASHFVTSTAGVKDVWVYDHPDQLFYVQASAPVTYGCYGKNFAITWCRAGTVSHCNRTLGISKHILSAATGTANYTNCFRVIGHTVPSDQANTTATAYNYVYGKINERYHFWTAYNATPLTS